MNSDKATEINTLRTQSLEVRRLIVQMASQPEGAHLGGALSVTDILCVLFFSVMRFDIANLDWPDRDFFILSKGHAAVALYAVLARIGLLTTAELETYACDGSRLGAHPSKSIPGVEFPTGSLGHGLSLGIGWALAAQRDGRASRAYVVLGDGEQQEGSVWEAALTASRLGLHNLIAITDRNHLQINGQPEAWLPSRALRDRWESVGWETVCCDGHDHAELLAQIRAAETNIAGKPHMIIADTVKGKGIAFLERSKKSHYVVLSDALRNRAIRELNYGS